jgi:hypothetical protein
MHNINKCVSRKIIYKEMDVLDNRQNFVDGRRKQSRLPKRRALLNIRRHKIQARRLCQ